MYIMNYKLLLKKIKKVKATNEISDYAGIDSSLDHYRALVDEACCRWTSRERVLEIKDELKVIRRIRKELASCF